MKKYFLKDTEEELQFGDQIKLDFTEDMEDGHVTHHHLDCKFVPELVPMLVAQDIIDVVGEEPIDFEEGCPVHQLDGEIEVLKDTVKSLQEAIATLQKTLQNLVA